MDELLGRVAGKLRMTSASGAAAPSGPTGRKNDPYELNPPLPLDRVAAFERGHEVRLPEAYRRFVVEVGDGDTGDGGLYSLDQAYEELSNSWDPDDYDGAGFLAHPSPYQRGATYTVEWWDANYGPRDRPDQLRGTLPIQEGGCSDFYFLVVTGADAGAIYSANWDGNAGPVRVGNDYLSWLERNLDLRVLSYADRWTDEVLGGGEPQLLDVLASDPHEYRRMWAAFGVRRSRRLSERAREALAAATRDEHYVVRAAALSAIRAHAVGSLTPAALHALADDSSEVRLRALLVLETVEYEDLTAVARDRLTDPSSWMRQNAIRLLHDRGALTVADIADLLADPEWTVRRDAMSHLPDLDADTDTDAAAELVLAEALADESSSIRWQAVDQIVGRGDPGLTALLPDALAQETDFSLRLKLERHLKDR